MGNDDIGVGNGTAARKPAQQMAGAMSQQGGSVLGDNQCTQQKLVRLVGSTMASASARNSTNSRRNLALFNCSRVSLSLRVASDNFCETSACQPWI